MGERGGELIAADEPTIVVEPLLDAIVVEDGLGDRRLSNPACTDKSGWCEVFHEANDLFDQHFAPETDPWRRGWGFTG